MTEKAFLRTWGLASVDPTFSQEELLSLRPSSFVAVHHMSRGETMQSLAVRYGVSDVDIRVLNNLLSERALTAHSSVYVPLLEHDATALDGKHLRRDVTGALGRVLPVCFSWECHRTMSQLPVWRSHQHSGHGLPRLWSR